MINRGRMIWEGWTVGDFIDELAPQFDYMIQSGMFAWRFDTDEKLKKWICDNQPYYKKHIPDVYSYFIKKLKDARKKYDN